MALPKSSDLLNMEYASQGEPFLDQTAKSGFTLLNMEFASQGEPFVRNEQGASARTTSSMGIKLVAEGII